MNIFSDTREGLTVIHPDFRKSLLPNRSAESEIASCTKGKTALDQLNGFLHGHPGPHSDQRVEVVGHDHKFVEQIFSLLAIVIQYVDQKTGGANRLKKSSFLPRRGRYEEGALAGDDV